MKTTIASAVAIALSKNAEFFHIRKEEIEDCVQDAVLLFEKKKVPDINADEDKMFLWLFAAAILIHKNHFRRDKRNTSLEVKKEDDGSDYDSKDDAKTK